MFLPTSGNAKETYQRLHALLLSSLKKIDKCLIRSEYKLEMYSTYLIPSLYYYLTVHNLERTHLRDLDSLARRYLKRWANIPPSTIVQALYDRSVFRIPSIEQTFKRCRVAAHVRMRLKADNQVQHVLDARIERESTYKRKMKPTVEAEQILSKARRSTDPARSVKVVVQKAKHIVDEEVRLQTLAHLTDKLVQGRFTEFMSIQEQDPVFRSIMYDLPRSQLSFLMRMTTDTLPTRANLVRWKKVVSPTCTLCGSDKETLNHCLQHCPVATNQDRTKWRHDSVLLHVVKQLKRDKHPAQLYADLPGHALNDNGDTIPPHILATRQRPDLVLVNNQDRTVRLIELTCPADTNIDKARAFKNKRDKHLEIDINNSPHQWTAEYHTFEVTSSGQVRRDSRQVLRSLFSRKTNRVCKKLARIALHASYFIFHARVSREWCSPHSFELDPD